MNVEVKLTESEIALLLVLVDEQIESGIYWGRKDHFDKRIQNLKMKLKEVKNGMENQ